MPTSAFASIAAAVVVLSASGAATAAEPVKIPKTQFSLEQCMNAALSARRGDVKAVEMELNNGVPVYEFTLRTEDDAKWEVTCNAMTGKIIAQEKDIEEGGADGESAELFDKAAKITEQEAKAIALHAHAGELEGVERKMSSSGVPIYEIEIRMSNGREREVEVNAVTGLIINVEEEIYSIGDD